MLTPGCPGARVVRARGVGGTDRRVCLTTRVLDARGSASTLGAEVVSIRLETIGSRHEGGRVSLDSVAVTDELIRLARWLEAQPWNRPGSDKTWVLRCADSFREFAAARKRARAVAR